MVQIITYLFLAIGLMMFIFAALQLALKKKTRVNFTLSFLFATLGYIWLYYGWYRANRLAGAPWLLYSDIAVTFLAGPILYYYVECLTGYVPRSLTRQLLPYVPAMAALVYLIVARPASRVSAALLPGPNPDHFAVPAVNIINTLGDIHFFCHVAFSTLVIGRFLRTKNTIFRKMFRGVFLYFTNSLFTFILFFAGHALQSDNILGLAVLLNGINSAYYFFLSYRYPEYTQRAVRAPSNGDRPPLLLRGLDVPAVLAELGKVIETEGGYREPDLTLQSLSTRLGIQNHQLSLILNEYMGTSFRNYINRRRVAEAKRLLAENPDMPVLDTAFEVGFNSKSVFNSAFVKETGLSPSAFRKKLPRTS